MTGPDSFTRHTCKGFLTFQYSNKVVVGSCATYMILYNKNLRALKFMGYEPSGPFITSVLELKLDAGTMFEWQKHTNSSTDVPYLNHLLEFVNLRAQASEHAVTDNNKRTTSNDLC